MMLSIFSKPSFVISKSIVMNAVPLVEPQCAALRSFLSELTHLVRYYDGFGIQLMQVTARIAIGGSSDVIIATRV